MATNAQIIAALVPSGAGFSNLAGLGTPVVVTYSFMEMLPGYFTASNYPGFETLTSAQRANVRVALQTWADISGLILVEVPDNVGGDIRVGMHDFTGTDSSDAAAYAYRSGNETTEGADPYSGDIFLDSSYFIRSWDQAWTDITPSEFTFLATLHEIGHAVGLKHPFESGPTLPAADDTVVNTVMSYEFGSYPYPTTPQPYDNIATDHVYGDLNAHLALGWTFNWDATNYQLTAIGSATADSMVGTNVTDLMSGLAGNDTLWAMAGDDVVDGGSGADTIHGGEHNDVITGGDDNDTIRGGSGYDTAVFSGLRSDYTITNISGGVRVTDNNAADGDDGVDNLYSVEVLQFTDQNVDSTSSGDDYEDDITTTGTVAVGGFVAGNVQFEGDRDFYSVTLIAGHAYQIDLKGSPSGVGTNQDPFLYGVFDSLGNLIPDSHNDDIVSGVVRESRVTFTPTASGVYYISAGAWGTDQGTYRLSIADTSLDDYTANIATTGTVSVGGTATGQADGSTDHDWFAVTLIAGYVYNFDLRGAAGGNGTLPDPAIIGLFDSTGTAIPGTSNDDDPQYSPDAHVTYTATTTGTHYISVSSQNGFAGTYELSVDSLGDGSNLIRPTEQVASENNDLFIYPLDGVAAFGLEGEDRLFINNNISAYMLGGSDNDDYFANSTNHYAIIIENGGDSGDHLESAINLNHGLTTVGIVDGRHLFIGSGSRKIMIIDFADSAIETFKFNGSNSNLNTLVARVAFNNTWAEFAVGHSDFPMFVSGWTEAIINDGIDHLKARALELENPVPTGVTLVGDGLANVLTGTAYADDLSGMGGDDTIDGLAGDDILNGGDGDDVLDGGLGADALDGGADTDTASYGASSEAVEVKLWAGTGLFGDAAGDTLINIENLVGSAFDDQLAGNALSNHIWFGDGDDTGDGGNGDDVLEGEDGEDALFGGGGADTLYGGSNDDYLNGGSGDDILEGGTGSDLMNGTSGNDTVSYAGAASSIALTLWNGQGQVGDAAGDVLNSIENIIGSDFGDTIFGSFIANHISFGAGDDVGNGGYNNDIMLGEDGEDILYGDAGDDIIRGGADDDGLHGRAGNDLVEGGAGADRMYGFTGRDTLSYASSTSGVDAALYRATGIGGDAQGDTFYGFEDLEGSAHSDTLAGDAGDNSLELGAGDDFGDGRWGNDTLNGEGGSDTLTGGPGDDLFIFTEGDGVDIITDFVAGSGTNDVIDFSGHSVFNSLADVTSRATELGGHTTIDDGAGNTITLYNVAIANLHQDDFNFVSAIKKPSAMARLDVVNQPPVSQPGLPELEETSDSDYVAASWVMTSSEDDIF